MDAEMRSAARLRGTKRGADGPDSLRRMAVSFNTLEFSDVWMCYWEWWLPSDAFSSIELRFA
jgi:hypothetical protein